MEDMTWFHWDVGYPHICEGARTVRKPIIISKFTKKHREQLTAASIASSMNRASGEPIGPRGKIRVSATFLPSSVVDVLRWT